MRYQDRIYNKSSVIKNRDVINTNMSSDICVFYSPTFNVSGATKINCSANTGTTGVRLIETTATTIDFNFYFTGYTSSFYSLQTSFRYEVYKYNNGIFQTG